MVTGIIMIVLGVATGLWGAYTASLSQAGAAYSPDKAQEQHQIDSNAVSPSIQNTPERPQPDIQIKEAAAKNAQLPDIKEKSMSATVSRTATSINSVQNSTPDSKKNSAPSKKSVEPNGSPNTVPRKIVVYFARGSRHVSSKNRIRIKNDIQPGWKYEIRLRCADADTHKDAVILCKERRRELIRLMKESGLDRNRTTVRMEIPSDPKSNEKYSLSRWRRALIIPRRVK